MAKKTSATSSKKSAKTELEEKKTSVKKSASKSKDNDVAVEEIIQEEATSVSKHYEELSYDVSVREKLILLYSLQTIDTRIDRIRVIRGELPLEVQDLEDEVIGLKKRLMNVVNEIEELKVQNTNQKLFIKDCIALINKYEEQQNNVRNNREFDSLNKEIQYQKLEIEYAEKKINDIAKLIETKQEVLEQTKQDSANRDLDLKEKQAELDEIISETEIDEKNLLKERDKLIAKIEERFQYSYNRLRKNARNGLAVVCIERDACGGCFNKIPPQRQMEIKQHRKIIVCEYCGRVLVDDFIVQEVNL
jgi:uncharacterized protein